MAQGAGTDRRVWVRYRSDFQTTCQPAAEDATPLLAQVRDISSAGVNLVVSYPFSPGALLSIDLPGPTEGTTHTLLASVVRVAALPDGEWALGCTLTSEVGEGVLAAFGAQKVRAADDDQRTWVARAAT